MYRRKKQIVLIAALLCMPAIVFAQRHHIHLSKKRAAALSGSMCIAAAAFGLRYGVHFKSRKEIHFANTPEYILWHKEMNKAI